MLEYVYAIILVMGKKLALALIGVICLVGAIVGLVLLWNSNIAVLNPEGRIAERQFDLIIFTSLLSLIIVGPVFALTFYIVWKYRATNKKARYNPDWDHSRLAEAIWWIVPLILITVLAVVTWKTTHELDPYRPIDSKTKPLTVQVIALEWKWLFIYPEYDLATVNYLHIPEKTPINFEITADAPMNSFWIPQLGGQVYAMAGMKTKLHLMANKPGDYRGSSANLSGEGFSSMHFTARATSRAAFDNWINQSRLSSKHLDTQAYDALAWPSHDHPREVYASTDKTLYNNVIMKYMSHGSGGLPRREGHYAH